MVLFMTTVHTGKEIVERLRRRPATTATNARTSRLLFGDKPVKSLAIPQFIDMYNHFIGGVDQADQLRSYYSTQHRHNKNWKALWHFLLVTTMTNYFKIAHCTSDNPWGKPKDHEAYRQFYEAVYLGLFKHSERLKPPSTPALKKLSERKKLSDWVHPASAFEHGDWEVLGTKHKECLACKYAHRRVSPGTTRQPIRKPLGELSNNTILSKKRRDQVPRTRYGRKLCNIHLCQHKICWGEHIRDR